MRRPDRPGAPAAGRAGRARGQELTAGDIAFIRALVIADRDGLVVLDKPPGLAVQGGSGVTRDVDRLLAGLVHPGRPRPKLVHRLDRETSGLLVAARTRTLAAELSAAFAGREVRKRYLAILPGTGAHLPAELDLPLRRVSQGGLDLSVAAAPDSPGAQRAVTGFAVLAVADQACLVEATPVTGRMHQIRAHLAAIGPAILGDGKYGGLLALPALPIPRLMLHAASLELAVRGIPTRLEVSVPADMRSVLAGLGLDRRGPYLPASGGPAG